MPGVVSIAKNIPNLRQGQSLDGTDYIIDIVWNMRNGWYIGLSDANDSVIFSPVKLVIGTDFLKRARYDARCPPGVLAAFDTTKQGLEAGYLDLVAGKKVTDLDGRVVLVYYKEEEITGG